MFVARVSINFRHLSVVELQCCCHHHEQMDLSETRFQVPFDGVMRTLHMLIDWGIRGNQSPES